MRTTVKILEPCFSGLLGASRGRDGLRSGAASDCVGILRRRQVRSGATRPEFDAGRRERIRTRYLRR
ncbi:MAG: hypothetical protein CMJ52_01675 [Planctomycetaceae bacterium]|nr:hypothetical protein [Planctomycetaceae bacterium]